MTDVQQTPPAAPANQQQTTGTTEGFTRLGDVLKLTQPEWEARREQVKRDLEAAIAETQAEIARLEAQLAKQQAQSIPSDWDTLWRRPLRPLRPLPDEAESEAGE